MNIFLAAGAICGIITKIMSNNGNDSMLMLGITMALLVIGIVTSKTIKEYL